MKLVKGVLGATMAAMLLTGCNSLGIVQGEGNTVVVSEDVVLESIITDAKVAVSQPEQISLDQKINHRELLKIDENQILYMKDNSLYSTNLNHSSPNLIKELPVRELSNDGRKALSVENGTISIYNIETGETAEFTDLDESIDGISFADPKGNYISYYSFESSRLVIIDTNTAVKTLIDLNDLFNNPTNFSFSGSVIHNDDIYLRTHIQGEGSAIYKIKPDHSVEKIVSTKELNDNIFDFEFVNDDLLVFNGIINKEPGIFLYDIPNQEANKVVSGGTSSEGTWIPSYSISPDGSKMLFNTILHKGDEFLDNVFIATIENNNLSRSIQIIQNAHLPAVIKILAHWSNNSSAFFIPRTSQDITGYDELTIEYISVYKLDKIETE
ncbi:hypothetical protein BKP45_01730 [Anaerobacillus alkalidiazotrophicus]|uniref:Uncharacterized protein n=1 Tax=Anaerobacillus alkalidiazotrophicus TaxID=472963 RepID=A0A1S2MAA7_9BACI|nr:hypothetical protein [Anaerobacillus alkalidiazotrophicus]OIJ21514.1 hypothetical protein BKP45_01730 [Anaerobacillus alkalidiazotrophicus]